jgi:ferrous iron transport protein A
VNILLSQLKIGQKATVLEVNLEEIPLKLVEMGCLPESKIELRQIAPLGDPLYFVVDESHIAIRKETANCITVKLEE